MSLSSFEASAPITASSHFLFMVSTFLNNGTRSRSLRARTTRFPKKSLDKEDVQEAPLKDDKTGYPAKASIPQMFSIIICRR